MRESGKYPKRGQYDRSGARPNKGMFVKGHPGMSSEKNPNWKGDFAGYTALHEWLYLHLGQPTLCEGCGRLDEKKYEWANISGQYKREANDWKRLCVSCHRRFDGHGNKAWQTRREQGLYCGKEIKQLDMKGNIVATYSSTAEATRITKIHNGNLNNALNGKRKRAGGYRWEFVEQKEVQP